MKVLKYLEKNNFNNLSLKEYNSNVTFEQNIIKLGQLESHNKSTMKLIDCFTFLKGLEKTPFKHNWNGRTTITHRMTTSNLDVKDLELLYIFNQMFLNIEKSIDVYSNLLILIMVIVLTLLTHCIFIGIIFGFILTLISILVIYWHVKTNNRIFIRTEHYITCDLDIDRNLYLSLLRHFNIDNTGCNKITETEYWRINKIGEKFEFVLKTNSVPSMSIALKKFDEIVSQLKTLETVEIC